MIHNVILIDKADGTVVTRTRFWRIEFSDQDKQEFLAGYRDLTNTDGLSSDTPVYVGPHKVFHSAVDEEMLLMLVTDGRDEDRVISYKVREGGSRISTALRGNSIGYIRDNLEDILGELIFTRFKISFVGSGGVGKSTLLRLLFGKEPAPGGYVPTINVAVDSSETIQFGTFLVTIWDFAGQAVFQDLWAFYFQGTDIIFLITDSSFRNVMQTKTLLRTVRKEAPAVPLFIVANKQDLPESMKADKIKRLLGAPTFAMVATDKTRREEFIRFMLEVAAKTVGVQLPDRPLSEMITVRRRTEEIEAPQGTDTTRAKAQAQVGYEAVPFQEEGKAEHTASGSPIAASPIGASDTAGEQETEPASTSVEVIGAARGGPTKILHLVFIVQQGEAFQPVFHLGYSGDEIDTTSVTSLISALDSFAGIDKDTGYDAERTDALETIEHEGNLVMVEKSKHFVIAVIVTNNSDEDSQRASMRSLLLDVEQQYQNTWDTWDGDLKKFEYSVFQVLSAFPMRPVSLDYVVRAREAGKPLPFNSREVGRALVEVKGAVDGTSTIGGLVRTLDLPRETVTGCLQIMEKFGWVDFKIDIGPRSILKKKDEVGDDDRKAYGQVVVQFVDLCDGATALEDVVRKVNVSLAAMKFVATKLVLEGVLDVVA